MRAGLGPVIYDSSLLKMIKSLNFYYQRWYCSIHW